MDTLDHIPEEALSLGKALPLVCVITHYDTFSRRSQSVEEYDHWRYTYTAVEVERGKAAMDRLHGEEKAKQAEKE